jgi:hypothetical protein
LVELNLYKPNLNQYNTLVKIGITSAKANRLQQHTSLEKLHNAFQATKWENNIRENRATEKKKKN